MKENKFACVVIKDNNSFGSLVKSSMNEGLERGLLANIDPAIYKHFTMMFSDLSNKGYHINGFILSETGGIEFLFYRNPEQKEKLKEVEVKDKLLM